MALYTKPFYRNYISLNLKRPFARHISPLAAVAELNSLVAVRDRSCRVSCTMPELKRDQKTESYNACRLVLASNGGARGRRRCARFVVLTKGGRHSVASRQ